MEKHKHKAVEHHQKGHHAKKAPKNTKVWVISIAVIAVVALLILFAPKILNQSKTLAIVNGEKVTQKQIDDLYSTIPAQYKAYVTEEQILNQTINEVLLMQEAEKAGITKTVADSEAYIAQQLAKSNLALDQFKESLKAQNMSYDKIVEIYRKQLIINDFLNKTLNLDVAVTEKEISDYYNQNLNQFKQDEQVRASHILVATEEEAKEVLAKIKAGADFAELAKQYSTDSSAMIGGDLGYFGKGMMVPEFEEAAFKLNIGEVSPIVKTQFGYHIIKLTDRKPAKTLTLSEVKDQIMNLLKQNKQKGIVQKFIDDLKAKADIKIIAR